MTNDSFKTLIEEGQKVALFVSPEDDPYFVTVETVNDDSLEISAPLMKGYYVPIETGAQVEIRIGNKNGLFLLPCKISDRLTGVFNTIKLVPEGSIDKIQRRELMRMQIFVDFDLEFPYGSVYKPPADFTILHGKRGNLSGGGLFFFANKPLALDFKLNARLNLEPHYSRPVIAQARVVRIEEKEFQDNLFGIAVKFVNIREGDRDKIISYVLHKERDIIRRSVAS